MQMTLLDLTQNILSSLSSDEVNSISDTTESMQVAQIVKNKYFDIVNRVTLPEHEQLLQLNPSLDASSPVLMYIPDGVTELKWLKYFDTNPNDGSGQYDQYGAYSKHDINIDLEPNSNGWATTSTTTNTIALGAVTFTVGSNLGINLGDMATAISGSNSMSGTVSSYLGTTLVLDITAISGSGTFSIWNIYQGNGAGIVPGYQYIHILPIKHFIDVVNTFNPAEYNVDSFTFSDSVNGKPGNYTFYYKNDRSPRHCTVLSNYYVIFDSYDSTQDSTLQSSKTMGWGRIIPSFQMEDTFVPNLDDEQFTLLLNEAKALAYFELKQSAHPLASQEIQRGWSTVQKNKAVSNKPTYFGELPNFGRRGGMVTSPVSYFKARGWDSSNG